MVLLAKRHRPCGRNVDYKLVLAKISARLHNVNEAVIPQHDEIIVEAREDVADQVQAIVKESMEEALKKIIPEVQFIVEPKIADSWKG
jgi:DNA polymerase I-like protein with 3'-5' exonuclease and polymerase domains